MRASSALAETALPSWPMPATISEPQDTTDLHLAIADLSNRLASDLEYLRDWSMNRDIWIIFRTIFVIRHDNAY